MSPLDPYHTPTTHPYYPYHTSPPHTPTTHPYYTPLLHTPTTHQCHTPILHTPTTHPYYTPLLHTPTTHPYYTPLLHTYTTHPYYTPILHTLTTHTWCITVLSCATYCFLNVCTIAPCSLYNYFCFATIFALKPFFNPLPTYYKERLALNDLTFRFLGSCTILLYKIANANSPQGTEDRSTLLCLFLGCLGYLPMVCYTSLCYFYKILKCILNILNGINIFFSNLHGNTAVLSSLSNRWQTYFSS